MSHHPPVFALFLFYEKKTCTKRKVGRGTEPALSARTNRSRAPTTTTERQYERARALLPCCGARKTLTLDGARLRFSTAATRPSPLHPPPAARRRAPPPPPLVSRVSRPETQLTCIRARLEYEIERCIALLLTSSRFLYRRAFAIAKKSGAKYFAPFIKVFEGARGDFFQKVPSYLHPCQVPRR